VAADRRPCYEDLAVENGELRALVERLTARLDALESENAELRRRLGQNSRNSSKPPSSDSPFMKPAPRSLRRKSGRKPGGQAGHPGSTLAQVCDPHERLRHEPGPCAGCGADRTGASEVGMEKRQVFDLPPMTVRVIEHQLIARRCACGITTCGSAPQGVSAPVQYGPRITAIVLYLYVGQFLSKKRTAAALAELFGTPISEGTVGAMTTRAADGLDDFLDLVTQRITEAEVAGFDETGLHVAGKLHWVHCARTSNYTLITCHRKRGREGINDAGVLGRFCGVAGHDAWAPSDTYIDIEHQLCCAHALRELAAVTDTAAPDDWSWADQAADALVTMQKLVPETIATTAGAVDPDALTEQLRRYRSAAADRPHPHRSAFGCGNAQAQRPRSQAA
jgi:transposase